jgi:hypothetical protein
MTRIRYKRIERINGKAYTRRKVKVEGPCKRCGQTLLAGSLFWRRGHVRVHIECFESMQRQANLAKARVTGGRKPVLDADKELMIDKLHNLQHPPSYIAKQIGVSKRTVIRYLKGRYHPAKLENASTMTATAP